MARATDCIVGKVLSDPRYRPDLRRDEMNDLIINSLDACNNAVGDLVKAHNRRHGDGSGEAFLLGPYFDRLPAAVLQRARTRAGANSR